jgi:hypothetical protein
MRLSEWRQIEYADGEHRDYRARTMGVLRRYLRMAAEAGRLPSLMGREFFRTTVTSFSDQNFEDMVNFVIDVERCLEALDPRAQAIIVCVVFQEHTQEEGAARFGVTTRYFHRCVARSLDLLSQILIERGLLEPLHGTVSSSAVARSVKHRRKLRNSPIAGLPFALSLPSGFRKKNCQEQKNANFPQVHDYTANLVVSISSGEVGRK